MNYSIILDYKGNNAILNTEIYYEPSDDIYKDTVKKYRDMDEYVVLVLPNDELLIKRICNLIGHIPSISELKDFENEYNKEEAIVNE
jgi:hypothetical protein